MDLIQSRQERTCKTPDRPTLELPATSLSYNELRTTFRNNYSGPWLPEDGRCLKNGLEIVLHVPGIIKYDPAGQFGRQSVFKDRKVIRPGEKKLSTNFFLYVLNTLP